MRCFAIHALLALSSVALLSCGGGTGGGGGGPGSGDPFTLLFADNFPAFPNGNWTTSGPGTASHDPNLGFPELGSLHLSGDVTARALASAFPVDRGLQILVRVRIPDSSVYSTARPIVGGLIRIEATEVGTRSAGVGITRRECGGLYSTRIEYEIGNGSTLAFEELDCGSTPDDRFVNLAFIVHPDGTSEWRRDGNVVLSWNQDFGDGGVQLKLLGTPDGGLASGFDFWYDDVAVWRNN